MTTLDYANDCDVCGADRRFCDCQQGRTSVFSNYYDAAGRWLLAEDHMCGAASTDGLGGCVPLLCLSGCPCECHRDSTRESGEDFLTEDFRKEASE